MEKIIQTNLNECVVVKFNDKEKYAAVVCGGTKEECVRKAAYFRGIFKEFPDVRFGIFLEGIYDFCWKEEIRGGRTVYESLPSMS